MLKAIIKLFRIKHYTKNLFVLIPLFFSFSFFDWHADLKAAIAFLSFCLVASSIYIFNDIVDREKDARHPVKKDRPIASGKVSVKAAYVIMAVAAMGSFGLAALLNWNCLIIAAVYFILNIAYSLKLKDIPILDVACIAAGFILRVIMGSASINVEMSHWLLLTVITISFFLGFGKRANELKRVSLEDNTRSVLQRYTPSFLKQAMTIMMAATILLYALWSIDPSVVARFGDYLIYTTPLVILLLLRYLYVLDSTDSHGDPVTVLFSDKPILLGGAVYVVLILIMAVLHA